MLKFSLGDLLVLQWFLLLVQKKTRNPHSQVFQEVAERLASSVFVAACWSDHTWLAEGWKKKGCKIAEFRCDATSDITINLHKRFLRKPSLDGDQDGFLERKRRFFGVCVCVKIWKSDIFTHQTRNRMSGCSKLCLAYTVCRYPKKIWPLRRLSVSVDTSQPK